MTNIKVVIADITKQEADAIVNPTNPTLDGEGGLDYAIHEAAGWQLREECSKLGGCSIGHAKITLGYRLPAKYVIHVVGARYGKEEGKEEQILADCYRNSLLLAKVYGLTSIAFPSIATGSFEYPITQAAKIAVKTVQATLEAEKLDIEVRFIVLSTEEMKLYQSLLTIHSDVL